MVHRCDFVFEKRKLFGMALKKDILNAVRDVFKKAAEPEYGCLATECSASGAKGAAICVTFTDEDNMREYNRSHRNIDSPTDVLSFPLVDFKNGEGKLTGADIDPETGLVFLGDVIICVPKAKAQAKEYGHSLKREIAFLAAHSCLHLLGYDHVNGSDAEKMEKMQEEILAGLGITRDATDPAQ